MLLCLCLFKNTNSFLKRRRLYFSNYFLILNKFAGDKNVNFKIDLLTSSTFRPNLIILAEFWTISLITFHVSWKHSIVHRLNLPSSFTFNHGFGLWFWRRSRSSWSFWSSIFSLFLFILLISQALSFLRQAHTADQPALKLSWEKISESCKVANETLIF